MNQKEIWKKSLDDAFKSLPNQSSELFIDKENTASRINNEQELDEKWSEKYKKSINCNNPKGFSQRAHCQGRKKKQETKEATSTANTGQINGPYAFKDSEFLRRSFAETPKLKEETTEKIEAKEATTSASIGSYSTPAMWAKSTKKKDWGPSRKPQYKGGKFVTVKSKCKRFPYCNQGDINALKITEDKNFYQAIKNFSKKYNISESVLIKLIKNNPKQNNSDIYK